MKIVSEKLKLNSKYIHLLIRTIKTFQEILKAFTYFQEMSYSNKFALVRRYSNWRVPILPVVNHSLRKYSNIASSCWQLGPVDLTYNISSTLTTVFSETIGINY